MYYKVNVYMLENKFNKNNFLTIKKNNKKTNFIYIGKIIVDKNENIIEEILTDFPINIFAASDINSRGLFNYSYKLKENNFPFFVLEDEFVENNKATLRDVDQYFYNFFNSRFKALYDSINIQENPQKKLIK